MAASKKTTKPTPKPPTPAEPNAPSAALSSADLSAISLTLAKLRAEWPALSADTRQAFDALATDDERAAHGVKTRAPMVLQEGTRWASHISSQLKKHASIHDHHDPERLVYLVDRLQRLQDRMAAERGERSAQDSKVGAAVDGRTAVMAARKTLLRKMSKFAGRRKAELDALTAALGSTDTPEGLSQSVKALTDLAISWQKRTDKTSVILARTGGLTDKVVRDVLDAAKALATSGADVALAGQRVAKDSPAVNILEGAVLLEMREAYRDFVDAHAENLAVQKLTVIPALRGGLGLHKGKKGKAGKEDEVDELDDDLEAGADEDEAAEPEADEQADDEPAQEDEVEEKPAAKKPAATKPAAKKTAAKKKTEPA